MYIVIFKPKGIFGCQGDLIGKFSIVWSRLRCSVAVKTRGGQSKLPCTGGGHFHLRAERWGGRAAHVSYLQRVCAPPPSGVGVWPGVLDLRGEGGGEGRRGY